MRQALAVSYSARVPSIEYAVKVGDLPRVRIPSSQSVARPEATSAAQEVNDTETGTPLLGDLPARFRFNGDKPNRRGFRVPRIEGLMGFRPRSLD